AVAALPPPVLGALGLLLFGLVTVSGLRLIASAGLGQRDALIVAISLGVGLVPPTQPALIAKFPELVRAVLESGISAGGLTAIALNLAWRKDVRPSSRH